MLIFELPLRRTCPGVCGAERDRRRRRAQRGKLNALIGPRAVGHRQDVAGLHALAASQ